MIVIIRVATLALAMSLCAHRESLDINSSADANVRLAEESALTDCPDTHRSGVDLFNSISEKRTAAALSLNNLEKSLRHN